MTSPVQVSFVIVTYQSASVLPALITSLLHHMPQIDYEIICVDNASTDSPQQCAPHAHWIHLAHNIGYGAACNVGVQHARANIIVCMNPDLVVTAHWLEPLIHALTHYPHVAIIAPETPHQWQSFQPHPGIADRDTLSGAVFAMRRSTWEALGGFDTTIFLYWEDTDLCWRAQRAGYRTVVATDSLVIHQRGGSGGGAHLRHYYLQNGIYVHLKSQSWWKTTRFIVRQLLSTLYYGAVNPRLWLAWWWNITHLVQTLSIRRRFRNPH